jgi:hypothetical protein
LRVVEVDEKRPEERQEEQEEEHQQADDERRVSTEIADQAVCRVPETALFGEPLRLENAALCSC